MFSPALLRLDNSISRERPKWPLISFATWLDEDKPGRRLSACGLRLIEANVDWHEGNNCSRQGVDYLGRSTRATDADTRWGGDLLWAWAAASLALSVPALLEGTAVLFMETGPSRAEMPIALMPFAMLAATLSYFRCLLPPVAGASLACSLITLALASSRRAPAAKMAWVAILLNINAAILWAIILVIGM